VRRLGASAKFDRPRPSERAWPVVRLEGSLVTRAEPPSVRRETVRTHRARILKKLSARSMTHALALALKAGQIKVGDL
jgi:hypothetical protein